MSNVAPKLQAEIVGLRLRLTASVTDAEGMTAVSVDLTLAESEAFQRTIGKLHAQLRAARAKDPKGA